MTGTVEILHDPDNGRFEAMVDGHCCELVYHLDEGLMSIVHTGVPSDVGGRGIAAQLVAAAFATARARGWKVRPSCSYAALWVQRHPDVADLLFRSDDASACFRAEP